MLENLGKERFAQTKTESNPGYVYCVFIVNLLY